MTGRKFGSGTKIHLSWACDRICLNNSYLFKVVELFFRANGYTLTDTMDESDVIVLNTCGYIDEVMDENVRYVRRVRDRCGGRHVIVFGCLPRLSDKIGDDGALTLIGPNELSRFSELFDNRVKCGDCSYLPYARPANTPEMLGEVSEGFIHIAEGCVNACSYCNIKIAKESLRSKALPDVVREAQRLASLGMTEITLLADDCGSYGHDLGTDIAELISALLGAEPGLKVKIYTIYPGLFLRYFPSLERHYSCGRISYTCLPLQSGSPRVLELMNRRYDLSGVVDAVSQIRRSGSGTRLFTHFIMDFPTESVDEFNKSLELAPFFDYTLWLPYGENHRTPASLIDGDRDRSRTAAKASMAREAIRSGRFKGLVVG